MTFRLPRDLVAPSEKSMAVIHNAFSHYFYFTVAVYVECFDVWVEILYVAELRGRHNLAARLESERLRYAAGRENVHRVKAEGYIRDFLGRARERLSGSLGHYLCKP